MCADDTKVYRGADNQKGQQMLKEDLDTLLK